MYPSFRITDLLKKAKNFQFVTANSEIAFYPVPHTHDSLANAVKKWKFYYILFYFSDSSLKHKEVELLQFYRSLPNQEKQLLPEQGKLLMRIRRSRKNNLLSPEEGAVLCGSAVTRSCNFSHENIYFFVQKCFRRILFKILTFFFNLSIVNPKSHPV